ncbi:MAG: HAMP domain-containing histidine kinase [Chloroflexi bacterium]|nr:MAG: HAMP domain-containing histidine kinase [Chloroflexota bacterium]
MANCATRLHCLVVKYGPVATLVFVATSTYAIIYHRLFDIKLAAVRSVAYAGVLLSLSAIYYLFAYLLSILIFKDQVSSSVSVSPINILLALLLAFMFQPIKRFFDKLTDSVFFRNTYRSDDFFAQFNNMLSSMSDLRGLLERAATDLVYTMKAHQGYFYIHQDGGHHISAGTKRHAKMVAADVRVFDDYISKHGDAIIITQLLEPTHPLYRIMISYRLALVLPLQRADTIIGYLCLGEQQGSGYSRRDIKTLETVSDELVVAIQNAISIQEVKELNATLQQRIDEATHELRRSNEQLRHIDEVKDEFISMASHQLRTPLTSIKGYISMVLEGDMGKITPQQRTVLEESFNSSERMVRLISDFLNVSRLQTGKFVIEKNPADLANIVQQEVDSLQVIAKTHDMKLSYEKPTNLTNISLDEAKIRQVIMNFIDNAIYYSKAKTKIVVKLEQRNDALMFTVNDTGIGVPLAEQSKLFAKFFRASNARKQRPDGTGVGLFLAKKVVTAHGGSMVFSSVEGEGSIFGFSVPTIEKHKKG